MIMNCYAIQNYFDLFIKTIFFDHKTIENIWKIEDNRIHAGNTESYVNMSKPS